MAKRCRFCKTISNTAPPEVRFGSCPARGPMKPITKADLDITMFYTRPDEDAVRRHGEIQQGAHDYGMKLIELCPNPSRELSLAMEHLEQARMWASAGVAHSQERRKLDEKTS